ncbi:MAG: glycosyltransferase, partial [Halieaceae bacterium]|nr:glycosyltransferase [Halieaceae bacterium]
LYRLHQDGVPVRVWTLTTPILSTVVGHSEYAKLLEEIRAHLPVSRILVSTLIGHSLDIYKMGLPIIHILHDYYPWCPPLYATWETPCQSCNSDRMTQCLVENDAHRFFRDAQTSQFLAVRDAFVDCIAKSDAKLVAPSESVAQRWRGLSTGFADTNIAIIAHGLSPDLLSGFDSTPVIPAAKERLRVVVIGSLAPHKGGALLEAALDAITAFADLHLIGCGSEDMPVKTRPGVVMVESYVASELPALLADAAPDVALLLSVVPETFSYTLSEIHAANIPCVATNLGAFADRIVDDETGFLIDVTPQALVAQLTLLNLDRGRLAKVRQNLAAQQPRLISEMVADYAVVSAGLLAYQRPRWPMLPVGEAAPKVFIGPELTYRDALCGFLAYSLDKVRQSPRLPAWMRGLLSALLRRLIRFLCER